MRIKNKVFVITGAGGGIGSAMVAELLDRGAKVAAVDLKPEALARLKERVGGGQNISLHALDITDRKAVSGLPGDVIKAHGKIDAVINNAGIIQPFIRVNDLDYGVIERVINVNFYGTLYMTKTFLPYLLKRPEAYVVNVSSMGGFLPVPGQSVYGASKAAVKLLTEGLYAELLDTNVHVSVVFPGATNTKITENSGVAAPQMPTTNKQQDFQMLPASEVARIILDGVENNKPQIFTGKDSKMMNKLYRLHPVFATKLIAKQMKALLS